MKNVFNYLLLKPGTQLPISPYVTLVRLVVLFGGFFLLFLWSEDGDRLWVFYVICFVVLGLSIVRHLLIKVPFIFGSIIDSVYFVTSRVFVVFIMYLTLSFLL